MYHQMAECTGILNNDVRLSPLAASQRQYPAELEVIDAPHVEGQDFEIAEIQDQVPGIMSMADSEDTLGSVSPVDRINT